MLRTTTLITGSVVGAPYTSTQHWEETETGAGALNVVTDLGAFWNSVKVLMAAGLTVTVSGEVEAVDPVSGQVTSVFSVTPFTTTTTGDVAMMSRATQGLARLRTGVFINGRELRGRIFIPAPTETDNTNSGQPTSGYQSLLSTALATLIASDSNFAVWSRAHGQTAPVTAGSVWSEWAILRSRRD